MTRRAAVVSRPVGALAARHLSALDAVSQPVLVLSGQHAGSVLHANRAFLTSTGLSRALVASRGLSAWLPADARRRLLEAAGRAMEEGEAEWVEADPLWMRANLRRLESGGARYCVATLKPQHNGGDYGKSGSDLHRLTAQLMTAMELEGMAAWTWRADVDEISINFRGRQTTGQLAAGNLQEFLQRVSEEDRDRVTAVIRDGLQSGRIVRVEVRAAGSDDPPRWFSMAARRFLDDKGAPVGLVGVTRDITARKDAYRKVAEGEEWLRSILESEPECVKVVDGAGRLRLMNPAGLAMIEADDAETVLGRSVFGLIVPEYRAAFKSLHERVMGGETGVLAYEILGFKGGRRPVESRAVPLRDEEGSVIAVLSVTRDVSELRMLSREIIEASNREQERFSHDLHDGLGQELTGIALLLKGLQSRLARPTAELGRELADILDLVNAAVQSTRLLAHGLSPVAIERGGLAVALRELVARVRTTSGLRMSFTSRGWRDDLLDMTTRLHLYRIAQESLNNVLRHADARQATVTLAMSRAAATLRIADDGKGVDAQATSASGLGLKIMGYRAQMIGARLGVVPRDDGGTVVTVVCPCRPGPQRGGGNDRRD
jgi:PAS domain S-box-containing protein